MSYRPETYIGGHKVRPFIEGVEEVQDVRRRAVEMTGRDSLTDPTHPYLLVGVNNTSGEETIFIGESFQSGKDARAAIARLSEEEAIYTPGAEDENYWGLESGALTTFHILRTDRPSTSENPQSEPNTHNS